MKKQKLIFDCECSQGQWVQQICFNYKYGLNVLLICVFVGVLCGWFFPQHKITLLQMFSFYGIFFGAIIGWIDYDFKYVWVKK